MPQLSDKLESWSGSNKHFARTMKIETARKYSEGSEDPSKARVLSFAGARATFEKALVTFGVTTSDRIVTIQTPMKMTNYSGAEVLNRLINTRDSYSYLSDMSIWPGTFSSFTEAYLPGLGGVQIPGFAGTVPLWYKKPAFRNEMERFLSKRAYPFHILDIDICCGFSQKIGENVSRLMKNGKLASDGLMFINHQKGRDGGKGMLFSFLKDYFESCPYFDPYQVVHNNTKLHFNFVENKDNWDVVRYILTPIYYICEAFKHGYLLTVERLFEYRDRNKNSHGVNMLQWSFNFNKLYCRQMMKESKDLSEAASMYRLEKETFQQELDFVSNRHYTYTKQID